MKTGPIIAEIKMKRRITYWPAFYLSLACMVAGMDAGRAAKLVLRFGCKLDVSVAP